MTIHHRRGGRHASLSGLNLEALSLQGMINNKPNNIMLHFLLFLYSFFFIFFSFCILDYGDMLASFLRTTNVNG